MPMGQWAKCHIENGIYITLGIWPIDPLAFGFLPLCLGVESYFGLAGAGFANLAALRAILGWISLNSIVV